MPLPKCLFLCGTEEDKTKAKSLLRQVHNDVNLNPASGKMIQSGLGSKNGRGGFFGSVFGYGVGDNVAEAVAWVGQGLTWNMGHTAAVDAGNVFLCGWSRGAVTCFKVANILRPMLPNAHIHVFAIDPVPGNAGSFNSHMYADIAVHGLHRVTIICAELEERVMFRGVVPPGWQPLPPWKYIVLPGTHGSVATSAPLGGVVDMPWGATAEKHVGGAIVRRLMIEFLQQGGVGVGGFCGQETNHPQVDLLYCCDYAELMLHYRGLKKAGEEKWKITSHDKGRVVQQKSTARQPGQLTKSGPILTEKGLYAGQTLDTFSPMQSHMFANLDHLERWNRLQLPGYDHVVRADAGAAFSQASIDQLKNYIAGNGAGTRLLSIGQWLAAQVGR